MRGLTKVLLIVFLSVNHVAPSFAADKKDKSAKRAAMMMQKLKQDFEVEKANLQTQFETEKKALSEKLDSAETAHQELKGKLSSQLRKTQSLSADLDKVTSEKSALEKKQAETAQLLAITEKKVAELSEQLSNAQRDLKVNEQQRGVLAKQVSNKHQSWVECTAKNQKLYELGQELIHIYDSPSSFTKAMRQESFFQLKRVELENLLQEKQDQINAQHVSNVN